VLVPALISSFEKHKADDALLQIWLDSGFKKLGLLCKENGLQAG
jgi:hypothetical protein